MFFNSFSKIWFGKIQTFYFDCNIQLHYPMNQRHTLLFILLFFIVAESSAQLFRIRKRISEEDVERKVGVARIVVEAKPAKGTPIADIANFPEFFGEKSNQLKYQRQSIIKKLPPTTGDSLREVTSDSMAVYLRQNLYDWDITGEGRQIVRTKKNSIHDLPSEDFKQYLADTLLDEAIDLSCIWYFTENKADNLFKPELQMKMQFYDLKGASRPPVEAVLKADEIQCAHFKDAYGYSYNFNKGISLKEFRDGGIAGNVVTDVYLQALKKLLAKK